MQDIFLLKITGKVFNLESNKQTDTDFPLLLLPLAYNVLVSRIYQNHSDRENIHIVFCLIFLLPIFNKHNSVHEMQLFKMYVSLLFLK